MRDVDVTARSRSARSQSARPSALCHLAADRARLVERELLARVLEDRARGVRRGLWVPRNDLGHPPTDRLGLPDGGAGEGDRISDE